MKIQALLVAIAMAAAGSAFAATDTTSADAKPDAVTAGTASHKVKASKAKRKAARRARHVQARHHKAPTRHMASRHQRSGERMGSAERMGSGRDMGSASHMGNSAATTNTDVNAGDRQSRIDDAYAKWKATHN
jgi:hypothetical protein